MVHDLAVHVPHGDNGTSTHAALTGRRVLHDTSSQIPQTPLDRRSTHGAAAVPRSAGCLPCSEFDTGPMHTWEARVTPNRRSCMPSAPAKLIQGMNAGSRGRGSVKCTPLLLLALREAHV